VAALIAHGARPALQGEFTRRAVVNGKLDILQAEAINDLINAESSCGAQLALAQLEGGLSRRVTHLRAEILELEALITYEMDFPDEDDGPIATEKIRAAAARVASSLRSLIGTAPVGEIVRTGATVVIAGVPNVGKSSLFNSLIGHQRAIVADVPGTTRDALEAVLDASPYPLRLVDTAGIRETGDFIDRLGIEVSRDYIKRADVVLACGDSTANVGIAVDASRVVSKAPIVRVRTKSDLLNQRDLLESEQLEEIGVSATTGKGLGKLINHVEQILGRNDSPLKLDAPIVARARYRDALARACNEVAGFQKVRETPGMPAVVAAVHLREAVRALEELIGVVDVEEILAGVFSRFCVGK
jgi:tRNA modification GTPase